MRNPLVKKIITVLFAFQVFFSSRALLADELEIRYESCRKSYQGLISSSALKKKNT
jgi:hypothetical protein